MAYKLDKLNVSIQKYISDIIQFDVKNPHLGIVTVTGVSLTGDYSIAKVYVSFLGEGSNEDKMNELEGAKGYIRSELAKKLTIRKCPSLIFVLDNSFDEGQRIENLINEINKK